MAKILATWPDSNYGQGSKRQPFSRSNVPKGNLCPIVETIFYITFRHSRPLILAKKDWFVEKITAIPGRNLPVLNYSLLFAQTLSRPVCQCKWQTSRLFHDPAGSPSPLSLSFFSSLSLFCACHMGAEYLLRGSRFLDNLKLFAQMNWDVNVYSIISRSRPNVEGFMRRSQLKSRSSFGSDVELRTRLTNQLN